MMLLAVMDPEGTRQRKMHRLQRRTYEYMVRHTEHVHCIGEHFLLGAQLVLAHGWL